MYMSKPLVSVLIAAVAAVVALPGCATKSCCASKSASACPASAAPVADTLAPLAEPITSFGSIAAGGWLYVYGGHHGTRHEYSSDKVSKDFYRLNLTDGKTWEKLPALGAAQGTAIVAHDGYIYWIGGMFARNKAGEKRDLVSLKDAGRFNTKTKTWENLPALPQGRSSHDAVVVGDKLYVGGGWSLDGGTAAAKYLTNLAVLDLKKKNATWETAPQAFSRRALGMAERDGKIYFIGGMDAEDEVSDAVDVYDIKTGQWTKGAPVPPSKMKGFGASACSAGGDVYFNGMTGIVYKLSADGTAWETVGNLKTARFAHRLVGVNSETLVALGGESMTGHLQDLELFSVKKK